MEEEEEQGVTGVAGHQDRVRWLAHTPHGSMNQLFALGDKANRAERLPPEEVSGSTTVEKQNGKLAWEVAGGSTLPLKKIVYVQKENATPTGRLHQSQTQVDREGSMRVW